MGYSEDLRKEILDVAEDCKLDLRQGVYMANIGPSYETKAEVVLAQRIGADAVGMSTVPEAIVAAHGGLKTIGFSCLTNYACGVSKDPPTHAEVLEIAKK